MGILDFDFFALKEKSKPTLVSPLGMEGAGF
jgi:hypothetical protein